MSEPTLGPADTLTLLDIEKALEQAQLTRPAIRPSMCKCGKHGVYWAWTSKEQKEEADALLANDPVHQEFMEHLRECGFNHSLDPLTLDDIVAIDSERKV